MDLQELHVFEFQGRAVRIVMYNGEPVWVAKDVCDVLEIGNPAQAVSRLDPDEKVVVPGTIISNDGGPDRWGVTESGLYSLVLGSRKQEAREFKRWVTKQVLPSIRKYGLYAKEELLDNPELLLDVVTRLRDERSARLAAEAKIAELAPKAEFHDQVAEAKDGQSIRDVAKVLGTGQNRFFAWLRGERILMADNTPYQDYVDAGYFRVVLQKWEDRHGNVHPVTKTLVTGKGLTWLQRKYSKAQAS